MPESHYVKLAPHNPNGPVATAASIQLAASIPNFLILEQAAQDPLWTEVSGDSITVEDGYFRLPVTPGLGIELNQDAIDASPYRERSYSNRYGVDGSVMDI
jgi:galactonate dehydratase